MKLELEFIKDKNSNNYYVEINNTNKYLLRKTKDITNALVSYFRNVENLSFEEV